MPELTDRDHHDEDHEDQPLNPEDDPANEGLAAGPPPAGPLDRPTFKNLIQRARESDPLPGPSEESTADWPGPSSGASGGKPGNAAEFLESDILQDRYLLTQFLGAGSFGIVWKCFDLQVKRFVAIKLLIGAARDGKLQDAIEHELRTAQINQPRIAQLFEISSDGPVAFLVYQFIDGKTLKQVISESLLGFDLRLMSSVSHTRDLPAQGKNLVVVANVGKVLHFRIFDKNGKLAVDQDETSFDAQSAAIASLKERLQNLWPPHQLPKDVKDEIVSAVTSIVGHTSPPTRPYASDPREAADLVKTLAETVYHFNKQGIIHRDLKPGNIIIGYDRQPYIVDFGLSIAVGQVAATPTLVGGAGTPPYMAPEQAYGEACTADDRTDVYALGVILFQLLTGKLPYVGTYKKMIEQTTSADDPPDPRQFCRAIPFQLAQICQICMAKEPARRFSNAEVLRRELHQFLALEKPGSLISEPFAEQVRRVMGRERKLAALFLASLGIILITLTIGLYLVDRFLEISDHALSRKALEVNLTLATLAADAAGRHLEHQFETIEAAAKSPDLIHALTQTLEDSDLAKIRQVLLQKENPDVRLKVADHPGRKMLQDQVTSLYASDTVQVTDDEDPKRDSFSWFILDPEGTQIARAPERDGKGQYLGSLGRNFAFRTYYHGGPVDLVDRYPAPPPEARVLQQTQLSSSLFSDATHHLVIVVSAPIRTEDGHIIGVIGKMLELGRFARLPVEPSDSHFPVLVDTRRLNEGTILQHPFHLSGSGTLPKAYLDNPYRIRLETLTKSNRDYRDPFATVADRFAGRWLSSAVPIPLRRRESGLVLVAQQAHETVIGSSLNSLQAALHSLGFLLVLLVVLIVGTLWYVAYRVRRPGVAAQLPA
jgi:serine/threonine protein kinase